jgi:hypothetical protein
MVYFSIPIHNPTKAWYQKIPKTVANYSRAITNFTKLDFPLPRANIEISNMAKDKRKIQVWGFQGCSWRC